MAQPDRVGPHDHEHDGRLLERDAAHEVAPERHPVERQLLVLLDRRGDVDHDDVALAARRVEHGPPRPLAHLGPEVGAREPAEHAQPVGTAEQRRRERDGQPLAASRTAVVSDGSVGRPSSCTIAGAHPSPSIRIGSPPVRRWSSARWTATEVRPGAPGPPHTAKSRPLPTHPGRLGLARRPAAQRSASPRRWSSAGEQVGVGRRQQAGGSRRSRRAAATARPGLDGDHRDPDVLERADELAVEPRQLGRQHHRARPLPQRDPEQLAEVDAAPDDVDAELGPLQAAHERRLPGRPARARDDPGPVQRSWLPSKLSRPPPGEPVVRTTSRSALRIANARNTASSGGTESVSAVSSPSRAPNRPSDRTISTTSASWTTVSVRAVDVDLVKLAEHVDPITEPHPTTERVLGRDRHRDLATLSGPAPRSRAAGPARRAEREQQHPPAQTGARVGPHEAVEHGVGDVDPRHDQIGVGEHVVRRQVVRDRDDTHGAVGRRREAQATDDREHDEEHADDEPRVDARQPLRHPRRDGSGAGVGGAVTATGRS